MSAPTTLNELFFDSMDRYRDRAVLLRARRDGIWTDISAGEMADCVWALSLGFLQLDAQPGDRIGILSENRPEWAYADFASLTARCIDVPIYPTLPAGQIEFMLRDAEVSILCVSNATQLEKVRAIRGNLPALRHVITFDDGAGGARRAVPPQGDAPRPRRDSRVARLGRGRVQGPARGRRDDHLHLRNDGGP